VAAWLWICELFEYLAPRHGRPAPADARPEDLWHWEIVVAVADREALIGRLRAAVVPFISPTWSAIPTGTR